MRAAVFCGPRCIAEAYAAMGQRRAIKSLVRIGTKEMRP
jgi:hypothetical protein